MDKLRLLIGCAGWAIPSAHACAFPREGTHLERYADRLNAVEINSSFYRSHKAATYARWATAVPDGFQFAVKVPKWITHVSQLTDLPALEHFLDEIRPLGDKLGTLVIQLPPSMPYDREIVSEFFSALHERFEGVAVCEPRHRSWFTRKAEDLLERHRIPRVAAHPSPAPRGGAPGGWTGLAYYRLHGAPRRYYSSYADEFLDTLGKKLLRAVSSAPTWCILDNTAAGAATINALTLMAQLNLSAASGPRRSTGRHRGPVGPSGPAHRA